MRKKTMSLQQKIESLQADWEHAAQRDSENQTRAQPLDVQALKLTAGLDLKSGVRAGRGTHACTLACTGHFYTCSC